LSGFKGGRHHVSIRQNADVVSGQEGLGFTEGDRSGGFAQSTLGALPRG